MNRRIVRPGKWIVRHILLLLLFVTQPAFAFAANLPELTSKIEQQNTHIQFNLPQNWQIRILNNSPDQKIVLKLSADEKIKQRNLQFTLPENSGLADFKVMPFKPQNMLLVFRLKEPLEFGWADESRSEMVVHDRLFRDPAEREYLRGLKFHRAGDLNRALSAYRKAVFLNRKHGNAYFKAAQIRFRFRQYRLAEINFKHALRLKCDSLALYRDIAEFYRATGKPGIAEKYRTIYRNRLSEKSALLANRATEPLPEHSPVAENPPVPQQKKNTEPNPVPPSQPPVKKSGSLPFRIIFYLIGSIIILAGILIRLILLIRKKRSRRAVNKEAFMNPDYFGSLDLRKEKILNAAREVVNKKEENPPVESLVDMSFHLPVGGEQALEEPGKTGEQPGKTLSANADYSPQTKHDIARNLNLGVGEIELALNLKAQKRQASRDTFVESEIQKLVDEDLDVSEIARRMKLGQGEVELYMALNKRPFETEPI